MKLVCTNCDRCGAPLEIEPEQETVICDYCNCQLRVTHSDQTVTTEVIEELNYSKQQLEAEIEELNLRRRLDRYDRSWRRYLDSFLCVHGQMHIPDASSARGLEITGIVLIVGGGISFLHTLLTRSETTATLTAFGLIVGSVLLFIGLKTSDDAASYEARKKRYRKRRRHILKQIKSLRLDDRAQVERPQKEHR